MVENYVPFGDEWKKELMKHRKDQLVKLIKDSYTENNRLREALESANSLCRSALEIAERNGSKTNWVAFRSQLRTALVVQQAVMYHDVFTGNAK